VTNKEVASLLEYIRDINDYDMLQHSRESCPECGCRLWQAGVSTVAGQIFADDFHPYSGPTPPCVVDVVSKRRVLMYNYLGGLRDFSWFCHDTVLINECLGCGAVLSI